MVDTLESGFDFNELRPLEVTEGVFLLAMADETRGMLLSLFSGNSLSISIVVRAPRRPYIYANMDLPRVCLVWG